MRTSWSRAEYTTTTEGMIQALYVTRLFSLFMLPTAPSPREYTELLLQDIKDLIRSLKLWSTQCAEFSNQHSVWLKFQDSAADFILRHHRVGRESSTGPMAAVLHTFIQQFLLVNKLLCEFHVKKSWNEGFQKHVKADNNRDAIYFDMEAIMRHGRTRDRAMQMIATFSDKWAVEPDALAYCQEHWFCDYWLSAWAAFGRRFQTDYQTTTLPLERMHHTLKYTIMGGIVNRRPGALLDALFGAPGNDRLTARCMVSFYGRRLQEAHTTKYRGRLRAIEKRLKTPLYTLLADYEANENICRRVHDGFNIWQVEDGYKNSTYTVFPDSQTCFCSAAEYCAHLLLVDKIILRNAAVSPATTLDYTVKHVIHAQDATHVNAQLIEDILALFGQVQVRQCL